MRAIKWIAITLSVIGGDSENGGLDGENQA